MLKTLKGKISLVYLCLVIMLAVIGTASVMNLYGLSRALEGLMADNYKSISAVNSMLEALDKQDNAMLIYINTAGKSGLSQFNESQTLFLKWYELERKNVTSADEKHLVEQVDFYYSSYIQHFARLKEIMSSQGSDKAMNFYTSNVIMELSNIKIDLNSIWKLNEQAMFSRRDSATKSARNSVYAVSLLSILGVLGGFLASAYFINRLLYPVYSLTQTIKHVKAGDLNQQADIISHDEIGEMALEFNNMTKRLLQYEKSAFGELMGEKNKSLAIVKSISDPLIVLDSSYHVVLLNNACENFFGIREESSVNRHFLEVINNHELFDHISNVSQASGSERREKIACLHSGGKDYYFNILVTPVKGADTRITESVVLFQNVTQLKQLEKVKTDFISTVSHEFKTPLTSIMMGTSLMLEEGIGSLNEKQKRIMNAIKEDGDRLTALVNNLLQLIRLESGRSVFNIQASSIGGIIENSVKPLYEVADNKEVKLYYDAAEKLPRVNADYEKITWVINNLITNALKYTNAGDEISVTAFVKHGKMCIAVRDTGVGIPSEYLDRIFDKFIQVKGHDIEARGTGLGLAIVKEIVEAHGGEIWCESKLDVGSTFTFTLPLAI